MAGDEKANAGTPVSATEFKSLFESYSWYPKNWYKTFYEVFKKYDTYAITAVSYTHLDVYKRQNCKCSRFLG